MKSSKKRRIIRPALITSRFFLKPAATLFAAFAFTGAVSAADLSLQPALSYRTCNGLVLSCENGQNYRFCPRAISDQGDIVTGTFVGPRYHTHMRLIPMGAGYRYAGRGVWFDGFESEAVLHFDNRHSVACTVG